MVIHHDNDGGGEYKNIRTKIVVRFQGIILVRFPELQYTARRIHGMTGTNTGPGNHREDLCRIIAGRCRELEETRTRGDLGRVIAGFILLSSPSDIQQMRRNFGIKIRNITPEYRDQLGNKIAEHLIGTYQKVQLLQQQGIFSTMREPNPDRQKEYWAMTAAHCSGGDTEEEIHHRFLKFLLAGFCMFVLLEPGHAVGTPFPGGGKVQRTDGVYYCPVREKSNDVDAALCPFCPAQQTPGIGYLRPPTDPSEHQKQEFIEHCHNFHNFNG